LLSNITGWLVWIVPLIASLFVLPIARFSAKARDYFVVFASLVTAERAFSLVFDVSSASEGIAIDSSATWISSSGILAGVFVDPLSVLFTVRGAFFGLIIAV